MEQLPNQFDLTRGSNWLRQTTTKGKPQNCLLLPSEGLLMAFNVVKLVIKTIAMDTAFKCMNSTQKVLFYKNFGCIYGGESYAVLL